MGDQIKSPFKKKMGDLRIVTMVVSIHFYTFRLVSRDVFHGHPHDLSGKPKRKVPAGSIARHCPAIESQEAAAHETLGKPKRTSGKFSGKAKQLFGSWILTTMEYIYIYTYIYIILYIYILIYMNDNMLESFGICITDVSGEITIGYSILQKHVKAI